MILSIIEQHDDHTEAHEYRDGLLLTGYHTQKTGKEGYDECRKFLDRESPHPLLGKKHDGMRVSASGLLSRIATGKNKPDSGQKYALKVFLGHLEETAKRFYAGDLKVIDEFLQLYDLDKGRQENKQ